MTVGSRSIHDFCWINILSPEPATAKDFFTKLFGWTYGDIPGMGYAIKAGGKDVGGLFDAKGPDGSPTPPAIGVMVKVKSADDAGAKAAKLGGKSMPAFDVGPQGRMAVCFDPSGANIDVWEPKASAGMDADNTKHGVPSWFECLSNDPARDAKFYSDWFGWDNEVVPMGTFDYTIFKHQGAPVAGMMKLTPEMGGAPPMWGTYFTVDDVGATETLAVSLGATVCVPAMDVAGTGRFVGLMSPQGVMFYCMTYDPATRG
jgi:predicted enzyme related to lactoylglutathione lyase